MEKDIKELLALTKEKLLKSIGLTLDSVVSTTGFDPSGDYNSKELEPYDALISRFTKAVEMGLKFFRSYELYSSSIASDTIRDRLLNMEKIELISNVDLWLNMRDVRNRVVHDYLPEEIKDSFNLITGKYAKELEKLKKKINELNIE